MLWRSDWLERHVLAVEDRAPAHERFLAPQPDATLAVTPFNNIAHNSREIVRQRRMSGLHCCHPRADLFRCECHTIFV
jgi:hypothetical protein